MNIDMILHADAMLEPIFLAFEGSNSASNIKVTVT